MTTALTMDLLFNPNSVEFWQTLTGADGVATYTETITEDVQESLGGSGVVDGVVMPPQGKLDKLAIPSSFTGRTFGDLFCTLLLSYGTVAIALYR